MRRIFAVLMCMVLLCVPVFADNAAASCSSTASISPTGSCQITLTATIRLDQAVSSLSFPLGTDVSGVTLNGGWASTVTEGSITHVKLNHLRNQTGVFPVTVSFTVGNVVVTTEDGRQVVRVPLLSGFKYPVEQMSFSVTMPGSFTDDPEFFSGYHQQDIEKDIRFSVDGVTVSGNVTVPLKDSETLYMLLDAPEGMFPLAVVPGQSLPFDLGAMAVFAGLALLYWMLTLRRRPFWPARSPIPPEGLSAGYISSHLVHAPADLTMMVLQWAQMGYLVIHVDRRDRVFLQRKMDMGNERSSMEARCFNALFARGDRLEATSGRYQRLCEQVASSSLRRPIGLLPTSGNPLLFRLLCCGSALFAGAAMGDSVGISSTVLRILFMIVMGLLSAFVCWHIQQGMLRLHLRCRRDLRISLAACAGILLVGDLCNALPFGAVIALWGLLTGILAAYGGRHTESGLQIAADILALRRFLRTVSVHELSRILQANPAYFYELIPFAMALGVEKRFARQCVSFHLPSCKWLITDGPELHSSMEWLPVLRHTVALMDRRPMRPLYKILLNIR